MRQGAKLTESQFGFTWGAAVVTRLCEGTEDGSVVIRVAGKGKGIDVHISPKGNSVKVSPVDINGNSEVIRKETRVADLL